MFIDRLNVTYKLLDWFSPTVAINMLKAFFQHFEFSRWIKCSDNRLNKWCCAKVKNSDDHFVNDSVKRTSNQNHLTNNCIRLGMFFCSHQHSLEIVLRLTP